MIDSLTALQEVINLAQQAMCVSLDTEFVWEETYYPRLGIIQLGWSETDCFLIDVLAIKDLTPLGKLLADENTVKILHDAQQDLWILKHATGMLPRCIFDTRCAAGFVGMGSTLSLSNLLRTCLGVQLPKTETRTDWLQRPLSQEQADYALDDVRYLPSLYNHLMRAIQRLDRHDWLADELVLYDDPALYYDREPDVQYLRVKGTGRLNRHELAVVRELAAWRECEAKDRDVPRNRVFGDEALVEIARRKPHTIRSLQRLRRVSERDVSRYGEVLLSAVKRGLMLDERDCPPVSNMSRPNPFHDAQLDLAMAFLRGRCLSAGIDIPLVASRADVKDVVSYGQTATNRLTNGWRYAFFGEDLLALLAGKHAIGVDPDTHLPELVYGKDVL